MATSQKDINDPFETHKTGGLFGSLWAPKQQPQTQGIAGQGRGKPLAYKAEEKRVAQPTLLSLFLKPMVFFIITALSFTFLWEINKAAPLLIAMVMLCTVFDQSALGDPTNSRGEDINGLLPSLSGGNPIQTAAAMRVWLQIVVAWLAVFLGGVTGMNADETYMAQFYAIQFGREYKNVLANMPGAAYSDAGKVFFAKSSKVDSGKSIGFKEKLVYCAAPIIDTNQGRKNVAFWAIGYDCCDARGKFECGGGHTHHGGVRAPPDGIFAQDRERFLKAAKQSAAVNKLDLDEDVILLHWVKDPDHEAVAKLLSALGTVFIGSGLFALLVLLLTAIGLGAEHGVSQQEASKD